MIRRPSVWLLLALVSGIGTACAASAPPSAPASAPANADERLAELTWLEGHWLMETPGGSWEARYTGPAGGMVLSTNKSLKDGRLRSWEYEQFHVREGAVIMQPYPNGKISPVFFTLTTFDPAARLAVFENPEHDFPQILTYHRVDDTTLNIKVQARRDGELGGFELTLKRVD